MYQGEVESNGALRRLLNEQRKRGGEQVCVQFSSRPKAGRGIWRRTGGWDGGDQAGPRKRP